jgi:hypothetical protein
MYCLEHIWIHMYNFVVMQVELKTKHLSRFSNIYSKPNNLFKRERTMCLKSGLKSAKNIQKLEIQTI